MKTDRLRMPEHNWVTHDTGGREKNACRGGRTPGYATMITSGEKYGHLHCNRCGWVTPEKVVLTYSEETGYHYLTWEEYVAAETNGYVVIGTSTRPNTAPVVVGPYDTQEEAQKAQTRLRSRWKREERRNHGDGFKITTRVRILSREKV